ncbi:MAG TPA: ATP-binding protein [Ignavibacteriaceae bacterium]|nr:ATP-binding protein [Ignavibacteriaceae bacterium]
METLSKSLQQISNNNLTIDQLKDENSFIRILIDHLPDRIFCKDINCKFVLNNKAHLKVLGSKSQFEVLGKTDYDFRPVEIAEASYQDDLRVIKTGEKIENKEEYILDLEGNERWSLVTKVPLFGVEKKIVGLIGISRDITQRKKDLEAIRSKNCELTAINEAKDRLFEVLATDLKSQFESFISLSQDLSQNYHSMSIKKLQSLSLSLYNSSKNLHKLLINLVEWSALQRGEVEIIPEEINLHDFAEAVISEFIEDVEGKGIQIVNSISEDLKVFADKHSLWIILSNLISNAVKFSYKNSRIEISSIVESSSVKIEVKDFGTGISPGLMDTLFLFKKKETQLGTENERGTGIGLPLCKELSNINKFKVSAQKNSGNGTTFSLEFTKVHIDNLKK